MSSESQNQVVQEPVKSSLPARPWRSAAFAVLGLGSTGALLYPTEKIEAALDESSIGIDNFAASVCKDKPSLATEDPDLSSLIEVKKQELATTLREKWGIEEDFSGTSAAHTAICTIDQSISPTGVGALAFAPSERSGDFEWGSSRFVYEFTPPALGYIVINKKEYDSLKERSSTDLKEYMGRLIRHETAHTKQYDVHTPSWMFEAAAEILENDSFVQDNENTDPHTVAHIWMDALASALEKSHMSSNGKATLLKAIYSKEKTEFSFEPKELEKLLKPLALTDSQEKHLLNALNKGSMTDLKEATIRILKDHQKIMPLLQFLLEPDVGGTEYSIAVEGTSNVFRIAKTVKSGPNIYEEDEWKVPQYLLDEGGPLRVNNGQSLTALLKVVAEAYTPTYEDGMLQWTPEQAEKDDQLVDGPLLRNNLIAKGKNLLSVMGIILSITLGLKRSSKKTTGSSY